MTGGLGQVALGFTGSPLDRVDVVRSDPAALRALLADPRARVLAMQGADFVPAADPVAAGGALDWTPAALHDPDSLILLGLDDGGVPHFAPCPPPGGRVDARGRGVMRLLPMLSRTEAAIFGAARTLTDWHARRGFCSVCGGRTALFRAGWGRKCGACDAEHFPRVDPVVIMLAQHDGRVLVARPPAFPPGFYSALAGFVEPGESLEEAVAREMHEEASLSVHHITYVASQPWPFPSSLMIACLAEADSAAITLDETELEAAMWVSRDDVRAALAGAVDAPFTAPPLLAIARHLLEYWAGLEV